jgi:hypothetical protein
VSNFLDGASRPRSVATPIADTTVATTNTFKSDGAIGDVRAALAWTPTTWMRLASPHIISRQPAAQLGGLRRQRRFAAIADTTTVTYVGSALSAASSCSPVRSRRSPSYRKGNSMSVKHQDTVTNANVRMAFDERRLHRHQGTMLAVRTSKDSWTRMQGLGSRCFPSRTAGTRASARTCSARTSGNVVQIRAGGRWRTLPFGLTNEIKEKTFNMGLGTLLARRRLR